MGVSQNGGVNVKGGLITVWVLTKGKKTEEVKSVWDSVRQLPVAQVQSAVALVAYACTFSSC